MNDYQDLSNVQISAITWYLLKYKNYICVFVHSVLNEDSQLPLYDLKSFYFDLEYNNINTK